MVGSEARVAGDTLRLVSDTAAVKAILSIRIYNEIR